MFVRKTQRPRIVTLPDGSILTQADLPASGERWVARRKAIVVRAVEHGLIGRDEAIERYDLTDEELTGWITAAAQAGTTGLKIRSRRRNYS